MHAAQSQLPSPAPVSASDAAVRIQRADAALAAQTAELDVARSQLDEYRTTVEALRTMWSSPNRQQGVAIASSGNHTYMTTDANVISNGASGLRSAVGSSSMSTSFNATARTSKTATAISPSSLPPSSSSSSSLSSSSLTSSLLTAAEAKCAKLAERLAAVEFERDEATATITALTSFGLGFGEASSSFSSSTETKLSLELAAANHAAAESAATLARSEEFHRTQIITLRSDFERTIMITHSAHRSEVAGLQERLDEAAESNRVLNRDAAAAHARAEELARELQRQRQLQADGDLRISDLNETCRKVSIELADTQERYRSVLDENHQFQSQLAQHRQQEYAEEAVQIDARAAHLSPSTAASSPPRAKQQHQESVQLYQSISSSVDQDSDNQARIDELEAALQAAQLQQVCILHLFMLAP